PALLATAAAMRTQRVRIGLAAAILPFHDPIRLAEELAMVDILSGGRLDVGVGRGNRPVEFEGYRVPQIESRERFDETLAILIRAWTAERFSFEGRYFTIPEVRVIPKPLQQPHPPLYTVCVSPDTIDATALRGLPMLNSILRGPVDQLVAETLAVGSPDTVADKIAEMQRLGVGEVLCWMNFGGLPQAHVRRSMELFAREVMPRFR